MRGLQAPEIMRFLPGLKVSVVLAVFFASGISFLLPRVIDSRVKASAAYVWDLPLETGDRSDWKSSVTRDKGAFLADRAAYEHMAAHLHTGVDLQSGRTPKPAEPVYAAAKGKVYDVKIQGAGTRVTIAHLLPTGEIVYSSYIHIADVRVKRGMRVDVSTLIGRTFNRQELKKYGAYYDHLHFQLHRRAFVPSDTISLKTAGEVTERFYDPAVFFENYPKEGDLNWLKWLEKRQVPFRQFLWLIF